MFEVDATGPCGRTEGRMPFHPRHAVVWSLTAVLLGWPAHAGAQAPRDAVPAPASAPPDAGAEHRARAPAARLQVRTVSTRADRVSGDDVLVEIVAPAGDGTPRATLNDRDVSQAFRARGAGRWLGLLTGLVRGANVLVVSSRAPRGDDEVTLPLVNYPLSGPIVSGPHLTPFVCQSDAFRLPDGRPIGPALDANCTVPTRVQYVYRAVGASSLAPLTDPTRLPPDVARTMTLTGVSVPFVVRVETGAINRGIYQNAILHDPTRDPPPTPFTPPPAWNRRLVAVHGVGCPGGWYRQGAAMGVTPLDLVRLGEGYALFTNTLNHPTNSCNAFLAGETTMMGKERFIETFGVPLFTLSTGTSGGAYTSLQVADQFPGLIDGIVMNATFPDALSIAIAGLDAHLLTHYFAGPGASLSEAQQVAIGGYQGLRALIDAANQSQRTDPVPDRPDIEGYRSAVWNAAVPGSLRYHPTRRPRGARPTIFDVARNVYGVDPATGFARRPYDNTGVQYGLRALNEGAITFDQFLDLNARIGGVDRDSNYVPGRTAADPESLTRAYQSGATLGGGGGLASIPILDAGRYNERAAYHYQWTHFAVRERLQAANGRAGNHVMWRGSTVPPRAAWSIVERWVTAIAADLSDTPAYEKVIRHKPGDAVDGCWQAAAPGAAPRFIAEPQTFSAVPDGECNRLFPSYGFARLVAGGPLHANTLKCQLKPVEADDYALPLTPADLQRLEGVFPDGVCDWSKPGAYQVPVAPWMSFGPAPTADARGAGRDSR